MSKSVCRFFKRNCLGLQLSSTDSIPAGFCSPKLWRLIFLALAPWAERPGMGLGLLSLEISLPNFYPQHIGVGPACSVSVSLLQVWMDVDSLIL